MITRAPSPRPLNPARQEQTSASPSAAMAADRGRPSVADRLRFWLPIALILSAVWVSHTDFRFAAMADDPTVEEVDVIEGVGGSNMKRRLLFPAMALMGFVMWWTSRRSSPIHPRLATASLLLVIIVGASVLWSVEPQQTLRRASVVFFIAIAALGIGKDWTATDLCKAALIMSSVFVGISILIELQSGSFLQGAEYRFSGVFHPNRQAINTGVLTLSSLCLFRGSGRYSYLLLAILGIVLTKLTGSRGCILGLGFAIVAMYWITMSPSKRVGSVLACGICVAVGLILISLSARPIPGLSDVALMGRAEESAQDSMLHGRVAIWSACLNDIIERPLIGYGYGAFWTSDRVFEYSRIHDWAFSSAHSVYVETLLDIGILGAMVALAVTLIALLTSLRIFEQTHDWGIMFICSLICMGLVSGSVDVMFVQVGFVTILLAIGVVILFMHPLASPAISRPGGTHTSLLRSEVPRVAQLGKRGL